ncbi:MAG: hypothetical protein BZ137_03255, partial [Methanosphaera sp. rholeuAM130]
MTVDGNLVEVDVTEGEGVYEYTNTTVGKNVTVTGYFEADPENGYLKSKVNSTTFEVEKLDLDIEIDAPDELTAHTPATATVTLTNETDEVVPGEEVTVVITDEEGNILANVTTVTDDAGQVIVDFTPVTTSPVTISVTHPENDVYNDATGEEPIEDVKAIGTTIAVDPIDDTVINGTVPVTVTVTDDNGNPVVGDVELTFTDENGNTQTVTVTTDNDGIATYDYTNTTEGKTVTVTAELATDPIEGYEITESDPEDFEVAKLDVVIEIVPEDDVTAHKPTSAEITVATVDGIIPVGEPVSVVVIQDGNELANEELIIGPDGKVIIDFIPENTEDIS